jgi:hypothetical protein
MKNEPIRLRDDPDSPAAMRADLAEASAPAVAAIATAASATAALRLRDAIQSGGKLSAIGQVAHGMNLAGGLFAMKALPWIVGAILCSGAAVGALVLASPRATPPVAPQSAVTVPTVAAPVLPTPESSAEPSPVGVAPMNEAPEPRAASASPAPSATPQLRPRSSSEPADAVAAEMADLANLRKLARVDPEGALRAAEEGKRRFPGGLYGEDREAIAIGLLVQLGRSSEAKTRGAAFLARYPRSPFAEKVQQEIGAPPSPTP